MLGCRILIWRDPEGTLVLISEVRLHDIKTGLELHVHDLDQGLLHK